MIGLRLSAISESGSQEIKRNRLLAVDSAWWLNPDEQPEDKMANKIKSLNSIWSLASRRGISQERVYELASGLGVNKLTDLDETGFRELENRLLNLPVMKRETVWPDQREKIKALRNMLGWSNEYLLAFAKNQVKIEAPDAMTPEKADLLIRRMGKVLADEQAKKQQSLF